MNSRGLARLAVLPLSLLLALAALRRGCGSYLLRLLCACLFLTALASFAQAQNPDPADAVCPRSAPGSVITAPPDLYSENGVLEVTFTYQTTIDEQGLTRYCYITDTGLESPTLHVNPGDQLIIHFENQLPAVAPTAQAQMKHMKMPIPMVRAGDASNTDCPGSGIMTAATTNLHFHGMNVSPTCGQDDVINTMIQPGDTFDYDVQVPADEPPGLYWYHPHPHGFSEGQVQGGATGALIVEGIQNVNTSLAGLPVRLFVLRDQLLPNSESDDANIPAWDISLNYVPIPYPNYPPAVVQTLPAEQEFWRVLNSSADSILNVQYVVNGAAQAVQVVAIDGYPIASGGLLGTPQSESETSLLLPPGARAEFVVTTPNIGDQAQLVTQYWNTGPDGDFDPARPIANIVAQDTSTSTATTASPQVLSRLSSAARPQKVTRFADLADQTPVAQRTFQFSEVLQDPSNPNSPTTFFITLAGQTPTAYYAGEPPNVIVHQGTVEDWTIENTALEDHIFHIHQLHFQALAINGQPVNDPAIRDTLDIPYWSGSGPYPSATLRMDFRDSSIIGTFVYHCHILAHEDGGMMGTIQVLPSGLGTTTTLTASSTDVNLNSSITLTAAVAPAASGGPTLTGTVQFALDGNNIASPVSVSNGQATLTTMLSTAGNHTVTALYSGDVNYDESVSDALAIGVEDFTLSAPGSTTVTPGTAGNAIITVTGSSNFTSSINFSCSLPSSMTEAACFVNPSSIPGSGQVTLTVNTTGPHALAATRFVPPAPGMLGRASFAVAAGLLSLFALRIRRQKWRVPAVVGLIVLAILSMAAGCGGGAKLVPGTAAGTYNVVVTGTSGSGSAQIVHNVAVPITVQ
jgi:FtsP/CotA-like multicopper oxidase with cupredoxin domain